MYAKLKTVGKVDLGASPRAEGWKDVLQLLREENEKMEKLARALSVIQQGMLRNNPGHGKGSVSGRYPKKAHKGGEEGCTFCPRGLESQKREVQHIARLRCGHQRSDPTEGWGMAAGGKKEKKKEKS